MHHCAEAENDELVGSANKYAAKATIPGLSPRRLLTVRPETGQASKGREGWARADARRRFGCWKQVPDAVVASAFVAGAQSGLHSK